VQNTNPGLERLNLCVEPRLQSAPTKGNDSEEEVVHGVSLGVGSFLQVPLRQAVAGQAYIFTHPGSGVHARLQGARPSDRPTAIENLIQTRVSGPSPVRRVRLG